MKISEGGIGAPLDCVLGDVLMELGKTGPVEVTLGQLIALVRKTDRYTGLSPFSHHRRLLTPVGPTVASIRRVLRQKAREGSLTIERWNGPFTPRIIVVHHWDTSGDWADAHDPTQCWCGGAVACFLHDREAFRSRHAKCPAHFPCRTVCVG